MTIHTHLSMKNKCALMYAYTRFACDMEHDPEMMREITGAKVIGEILDCFAQLPIQSDNVENLRACRGEAEALWRSFHHLMGVKQ